MSAMTYKAIHAIGDTRVVAIPEPTEKLQGYTLVKCYKKRCTRMVITPNAHKGVVGCHQHRVRI